jgi:hypothetical protein
MNFWELHEEAEAAHALELERQKALELEESRAREVALACAEGRPIVLQDAPAACSFCPHFGEDVLLGVCASCAE